MGMIDAGMFSVLKDMAKVQKEQAQRAEVRHQEMLAAINSLTQALSR